MLSLLNISISEENDTVFAEGINKRLGLPPEDEKSFSLKEIEQIIDECQNDSREIVGDQNGKKKIVNHIDQQPRARVAKMKKSEERDPAEEKKNKIKSKNKKNKKGAEDKNSPNRDEDGAHRNGKNERAGKKKKQKKKRRANFFFRRPQKRGRMIFLRSATTREKKLPSR